MRYAKFVDGGYILSIAVCDKGGVEIEKDEYDKIDHAIENRPVLEDGVAYRLTDTLIWEQFPVPPSPPTPSDRLATIEQTQLEQDAALMELAEMLAGGAV